MKVFVVFLSLIFLSKAMASSDALEIEHIDLSKNPQEETHLYLSDGRVGILPEGTRLLNIAQQAFYTDKKVQIELDEQHRVISIQMTESRQIFEQSGSQLSTKEY